MDIEEPLFIEKQNLLKKWFIPLILNVSFVYYLFVWQEDKNTILAIFAILAILNLFFFITKLETTIHKNGITIKYIPFIIKGKTFLWNDIENCYVRKYQPLKEFGGWGLRFGIFNKGMAYTFYGNQGIQIILKNGKKILIGTQNPESLAPILESLTKSNYNIHSNDV